MSDRTSKTITTTGGHSIVIKDYLTGREVNEIKKALFGNVMADVERDPATGLTKMPKYPLGQVVEREEKLVEIGIVSFDGSMEGASEKVRDLPEAEYAEVVKELETLSKGNF